MLSSIKVQSKDYIDIGTQRTIYNLIRSTVRCYNNNWTTLKYSFQQIITNVYSEKWKFQYFTENQQYGWTIILLYDKGCLRNNEIVCSTKQTQKRFYEKSAKQGRLDVFTVVGGPLYPLYPPVLNITKITESVHSGIAFYLISAETELILVRL